MRTEVGTRTTARLKAVYEATKRKSREFLQVEICALTRSPVGQFLRSRSAG